MTIAEPSPGDEKFADRLAQYDEALILGVDPDCSRTESDPGLDRRLTEAQDCLNILESAWPRSQRRLDPLVAQAPPTSLGRFQFLRELGRGGHGVVFLAFDTQLRRRVALKVPRPEALITPELRARFLREAEIAARLDHPHLVPLYEVGQDGPIVFLVSAYCPGVSLGVWLRDHPLLETRQAAGLLQALATAMSYVHSQGVLHRDIKPGNILLQEPAGATSDPASEIGVSSSRPFSLPWIPRLTDFGLARSSEATAGWTHSGTMLGTLAYMAPEQADRKAGPVGPATDIHALGAVLYECLTGRAPFQGASEADVLRQILRDEPIAPRRIRREIPRDLETISVKCLAKEPGRRYASAESLAADLQAFLDGKPIRARPLGAVGQTINWARRRPALTASLALAIILPALFAIWTASYALQLRKLNGVVESTLGQVERSQARLRDENYAVQMKLVDNMQGNDPSGLICGILNDLRPGPGNDYDRRGFEWYYQWGLARRDLCVRVPSVDAIALSPDGKLCATGGGDGILRVWSTRTGLLALQHAGNQARIVDLAFSAEGQALYLITQRDSQDIEILVVRLGQREIERTVKCAGVTEPGRTAIDGQRGQLAFFTRSSSPPDSESGWKVCYWSTALDQVQVLDLDQNSGRLRFATGGALLVVAQRGQIQFWELPAGKKRASVAAPGGEIAAMAFSPGDDYLLIRKSTGSLEGWRLPSLQRIAPVPVGSAYLRGVSFTPDGKRLGLLTDDDVPGPTKSRLTLIDWPELRTRKSVFAYGNVLDRFRFGAPGTTTALTSSNQLVHFLHDSGTSAIRDLIPGGKKEAWSVAFSPDSKMLAVGYDDEAGGDRETLSLWDPTTAEVTRTLAGHTAMVTGVGFTTTPETLISCGYDGFVRQFRLADGTLQRSLGKPTHKLRHLALTRDGKLAATSSRDQSEIQLWDVSNAGLMRSIRSGRGQVDALALSPDCRILALACLDGELRLWDIQEQKWFKIEKTRDAINSLAFSPNGRSLAIGTRSGVIAVKDLTATADTMRLISHVGEVRALSISPDGNTLASAADDGTVRLWHMPSGREMVVFRDLRAHALAFSPDGTMLAAALHDGRVRVWRAPREE
jgi:eukaryotic-like serine/threonine-protein kinase